MESSKSKGSWGTDKGWHASPWCRVGDCCLRPPGLPVRGDPAVGRAFSGWIHKCCGHEYTRVCWRVHPLSVCSLESGVVLKVSPCHSTNVWFLVPGANWGATSFCSCGTLEAFVSVAVWLLVGVIVVARRPCVRMGTTSTNDNGHVKQTGCWQRVAGDCGLRS